MKPLEMLVHLAEVGTPPDDGDAVLKVSAGLQETLDRVTQETLPFVAAGGGDLQFVFGAYGRGKTHFLRALSQWVGKHGFVTACVDFQDNQSPFSSLIETYRAIVRRMAPPAASEVHRFSGVTGVAKVMEAAFADRDGAGRRQLIERVRSDRALAPDFRNLVLAYCNEAVLGDDESELAEPLEALLASIPGYRVTLGALYRQHPQLPRPLGKLGKRNAAIWLRALLSLPRVLGYAGFMVFFDETETVLMRGSPRRRQAHLAHVRTFVDHMATGAFRGCGVYYAVAEEFIDDARLLLPALSQRIERSSRRGASNPRAVWVDLDELTVPGPQDPAFFEELAGRIVGIGRDAGLKAADADRTMLELRSYARGYSVDNIDEGAVRKYVKEAASRVARGVFESGA